MSKHTEGPWGYEYSSANDAYEIAPIKDGVLDWENEICMTADNNEANAKLLSASSEMLEMLKEISQKIDDSDEWWMSYPDRGGFDQEKIDALITEIESE